MANTSVVQVWKDVSLSPNKMRGWRDYVHDLTEAGHQIILSSCWYINYITYGQDWRNFYNCDPTDFQGKTFWDFVFAFGGDVSLKILQRLFSLTKTWTIPCRPSPTVMCGVEVAFFSRKQWVVQTRAQ